MYQGNPYVEKAAKKTGESASVFLRRKVTHTHVRTHVHTHTQ